MQSVTESSTLSQIYDDAGNLINDGVHSYQFDAAGRIAKVDAGTANEASYFYDANNCRVKKVLGTGGSAVTTNYIWQGGSVIAEYSSGSSQGSGGTRYYHPDRLSTRMTTDGNSGAGLGGVLGTQDHLPFGEDAGVVGESEKHRFTSYERDAESGTDYAMNRQHQFGTGRFMRPDPAHGNIGTPQDLNRYAYTGNDPINWTDPLGLYKCYNIEGEEVDCNTPGAIPGDDENPVILTTTEYQSVTVWEIIPRIMRIGGGDIGAIAATVIQVPKIKDKICNAIPNGRTFGVSGALGAVGSVVGGGEIVLNYDTGQVSAFGFHGAQAGWNGVVSASVNNGYAWGLSGDNSNYQGGFSGFVGAGGAPVAVGGFGARSSGGLEGPIRGVPPESRVTVAGATIGAAALGKASGGGMTMNYTKPLQIGKMGPLVAATSPVDALIYGARQLCK
jgi:RHS repeat-associated protein